MSDRTEGATTAARVGRGTVVAGLVWLAARVLTLGTLLLLTRALPADDLGALFSAIAIGVLGAALAMGGLPDATTRHAAAATEAAFGRGDLRRSLVRFAATLPLIMGLLVLVAAGSPDPVSAEVIVASLLLAATQGGTTIVASIFRARGQPGRFTLVTNFLTAFGRAVVAVVALAAGLGGDVVLWSFVALNVGVIALTWRDATASLPPTRTEAEGDGSMQLGGVLWSVLGNLDVVVVGAVLGAAAAGQYGAALRLAEFAFQFMVAFAVPFLPEATRLAVAGRGDALRELYRTSARWSALVTVFAAGVGFAAAPELGRIVFPDDPEGTTTLLRILFVGYALHGMLGQTYSTLLALGAYREIRLAAVAGLATVTLVTVGLTYAAGQVGAACATAGAYVVMGVTWALLVRRRLGTTPFDERYGRGILASGAAVGVALLVAALVASAPPVVAVGAIVLGATAAWAVLLPAFGSLSARERGRLTRLRPRRGDAAG